MLWNRQMVIWYGNKICDISVHMQLMHIRFDMPTNTLLYLHTFQCCVFLLWFLWVKIQWKFIRFFHVNNKKNHWLWKFDEFMNWLIMNHILFKGFYSLINILTFYYTVYSDTKVLFSQSNFFTFYQY